MYRYNKNRRMQGGGQPPQTQMPPQQAVPQTQVPPQQMTPQSQQGRANPCDKALTIVLSENEKLKQAMQMSQIQMKKMAMIMEGKTPPSEARVAMGGAKNTPKRRGGSIKRKGGSCGLKMKRA